jgi:hypothetical protein
MTTFDLQEKLDALSLQRCFQKSASHEPVSVISTYLQSMYGSSGVKSCCIVFDSLKYLTAGVPDACRNEHQYVTEPQDVRRLPGTKSNAASTGYVARIM